MLFKTDGNVCEIDSFEADKFLKSVCKKFRPSSSSKHSLGAFYNGDLVGAIQFALPLEKDNRKNHSLEILNFGADIKFDEVDIAIKLIQYYVAHYSPADFFISESTFKEDLGRYEKNGIKFSKNSKTNLLEWVNPNMTYYTYKLTAKGSRSYYYGLSHVNVREASEEDCVNDGYLGSGTSPHFLRWKEKHKGNIEKTVEKIHRTKSEAFLHEAALVGALYKTDKNCLNSIEGGRLHGLPTKYNVKNRDCPIHGNTPHQGNVCCKCVKAGGTSEKFCKIHGISKHQGDQCYVCMNQKSVSILTCLIHGETNHQRDTCMNCVAENRISVKRCEIHGETKFTGNKCYKCISDESLSEKLCAKHGITTHKGISCFKCLSEQSIILDNCSKHGLVKHRGGSCCTCQARGSISKKICSSHGLQKHKGDTCVVCIVERNRKTGICEIHGEVSFRGARCAKCLGILTNHKRWHKAKKKDDCSHCYPSL